MIGRDFFRSLRLLNGRTETIKTRFELNENGRLVEHVYICKPHNVRWINT
jgi:hypothetical protein